MKAFIYSVGLQWKLDIRNKGILITYYLVPLIFFGFMGGIFSSINPISKETLIQSMTVFGVTMGALIGAPTPLGEVFNTDVKRAYKVGGIPLWSVPMTNFISAFIHLYLMSLAIFFLAPLAFAAELPINLAQYFFALALFIAVSLAVGTVLGLLVKSGSKLTMISQLFFLPSIMLAGIMFPSEMLPKGLQILGKIFPATWGFVMMTTESLDLKLFIPCLLTLCAAIIISKIRLSKIALE